MFIADIGLTADKIAEGETILGVTGTHSGGGGGVETCTVDLTNVYATFSLLCYKDGQYYTRVMKCEGPVLVDSDYPTESWAELIADNVVCNSKIVGDVFMAPSYMHSTEGATLLSSVESDYDNSYWRLNIYQLTVAAGETATIINQYAI